MDQEAKARFAQIEKHLARTALLNAETAEARKVWAAKIDKSIEETNAQIKELRADSKETSAQIKELRASIEETGRQIEKSNKETSAQIKELRASNRETSAEIKETSAQIKELRASNKETTAQIKETSAQIKELRASDKETKARVDEVCARVDKVCAKVDRLADMYGGVSNNLGRMVEEKAYEFLNRHPELGDMHFDKVYSNVHGKKGRYEIDIMMVNKSTIALGEVKQNLRKENIVRHFEQTIPSFIQEHPQQKGLEVVAFFACETVDRNARAELNKRNCFLLITNKDAQEFKLHDLCKKRLGRKVAREPVKIEKILG